MADEIIGLQKPRNSKSHSLTGSRGTSASQTSFQISPTSSLSQQTTADAPRTFRKLQLDISAQSSDVKRPRDSDTLSIGQSQWKTSKLAEGSKLKNRSRAAADLICFDEFSC